MPMACLGSPEAVGGVCISGARSIGPYLGHMSSAGATVRQGTSTLLYHQEDITRPQPQGSPFVFRYHFILFRIYDFGYTWPLFFGYAIFRYPIFGYDLQLFRICQALFFQISLFGYVKHRFSDYYSFSDMSQSTVDLACISLLLYDSVRVCEQENNGIKQTVVGQQLLQFSIYAFYI